MKNAKHVALLFSSSAIMSELLYQFFLGIAQQAYGLKQCAC